MALFSLGFSGLVLVCHYFHNEERRRTLYQTVRAR